ncbi:Transposase, L1 containing protein [Cricetulus griseus]|uniref:Transposase, L1 containing protein n=1 Tax=Cricetulus griseus TaxID=10029 RepID=A0A061HZN9_CRIGR|nr:Transposase, L1 containing protein [Cricetulus griseus]
MHYKKTDIRVLELFASTRKDPLSHTHQERERLLLHPPEERMRRGQCKGTFNNRKPNMAPPETRNHTPARAEHHNADEAEENDLKNIFMKMIEDLKEDMKKSLKEMEEKTNQKTQDINKSLKEIVQDLKTEIETIKKAQCEGMLEIEKLGKQSETTDVSITNRIQEMEERISGVKDTVTEIESSTKESSRKYAYGTEQPCPSPQLLQSPPDCGQEDSRIDFPHIAWANTLIPDKSSCNFPVI